MNATLLASGVAVVELGGIIALGVLLTVSRHQLKETRSDWCALANPGLPGSDGAPGSRRSRSGRMADSRLPDHQRYWCHSP